MNNIRIGMRLSIAFALVIALMVLMSVVTVVNFGGSMQANEENNRTVEVLLSAERMLVNLLGIESAERGYLASGDDAFLSRYDESRERFRDHLETTREMTADEPQQQERLAELETLYEQWLGEHLEPAIRERREIGGFSSELEGLYAGLGGGRELMESMRGVLDDFEAHEQELRAERSAHADALQSRTFWTLVLGTAVAVLVSLIAMVALTRSITRPTERALSVTNRIADGDLTVVCATSARDETGQLLNAIDRMRERLATMMQQINDASSRVASASEEMSSTAEQTRQGAEQQSDGTAQVATAMNEMTSTVQEVARNTQETADAAKDAGEKAKNAQAVVKRSASGISELAGEVRGAAEVIRELEQQGENIGQVLTVIRNIAEQTNLLALNAAIEAARAGEHGRGFSVVADEVRNLANNTQKSIGETDEIIEKLQSGTRHAVEVMQRGTDSADANVAESEKTVETLEEILNAVNHITDMTTQVASAVEEQTSVAEDINKNVTSINDIAAETRSSVNQSATATQELARLAAELQDLVAQFRTR